MRNLAVLILLLLAASAEATVRCAGTATRYLTVQSGQRFSLSFNAIPGARNYLVTRSAGWLSNPADIWDVFGDLVTTEIRSDSPSLAVEDELYNTEPALSRSVYYIVSATNPLDAAYVPCAQDFFVTVAPDAVLSLDTVRAVLPVAGSLAGLNGSRYETRLTLQNDWSVPIAGRVVFHPTGKSGAPDDPSLRYELQPGEVKNWDDVVQAMGASGLGSIDIVPEQQSFLFRPLPNVRAQVISVAAGGGEYGTDIPLISTLSPFHGSIWNGVAPSIRVDDAGGRKRLSLGVRTLGDSTSVVLILRAPDQTTRDTYAVILPPDYHEQRPIAAWFKTPPQPGDRIQISVGRRSDQLNGGAIVYIAETDNVTNDVALLIPRQPDNQLLSPIVQCGTSGCNFLMP